MRRKFIQSAIALLVTSGISATALVGTAQSASGKARTGGYCYRSTPMMTRE